MPETLLWSIRETAAQLGGVSVRTIQRLETSGAASHESRLALAAAFGLDPADLAPGNTPPVISPPSQPAVTEHAPSRQPPLRRAAPLLLIATGLLTLDLWHHHAITWSKWPLLGIAIGVGGRPLIT